jgi:hypothetical protein
MPSSLTGSQAAPSTTGRVRPEHTFDPATVVVDDSLTRWNEAFQNQLR